MLYICMCVCGCICLQYIYEHIVYKLHTPCNGKYVMVLCLTTINCGCWIKADAPN